MCASVVERIFFRRPRRLYRHSDLEHERLFELCANVRGVFMTNYDNADEVRSMARRYGFDTRLVPVKNTHHATMDELVIEKDLAWME